MGVTVRRPPKKSVSSGVTRKVVKQINLVYRKLNIQYLNADMAILTRFVNHVMHPSEGLLNTKPPPLVFRHQVGLGHLLGQLTWQNDMPGIQKVSEHNYSYSDSDRDKSRANKD